MDRYSNSSEGNQEGSGRSRQSKDNYQHYQLMGHREDDHQRFHHYNPNPRPQGQRQSRFDSPPPPFPLYSQPPPLPPSFKGYIPPPPLPPMHPPQHSYGYDHGQKYGNGSVWQSNQMPVCPVPPPSIEINTADSTNISKTSSSTSSPLKIETDLKDQVEEDEVKKSTKKPKILVGKRRGGRILPTGNLGVSKKPREEAEKGRSDAWSRYMAEVKQYKDRSCEEDRKNRPLVK